MARNYNFRKLKGLVLIIGIIIISLVLIYAVLKEFNLGNNPKEMVVLQPAPEEQYYFNDQNENNKLSSNTSYRIDNGELVINYNGKEYIVRPDGTVWVRNEDGTYSQVTDPEVINAVLINSLDAAQSDPLVAEYLDEDLAAQKIDLTELTPGQIAQITNIYNINFEQLKELVNTAKETKEKDSTDNTNNLNDTINNLLDALKLLDISRLSPEEINKLADILNLDPETLQHIAQTSKDNGQVISVTDLGNDLIEQEQKKILEQYLENMGLIDKYSVDVIWKLIQDSPYTFNDFMNKAFKDGADAALESIGIVTDSQKLKDSILSNSKNSSTTSNEPDLNIAGIGSTLNSSSGSSSAIDSYMTQIGNSLAQLNNTSSQAAYENLNNQSGKKSFIALSQNGTSYSYVSSNEYSTMLTAGTIINVTLITGINTDLPGQIVAMVSQNVYDSFTQNYVLIPKGSRLIATYDSSISWGQDRILIVWNQLIRPDGLIVNLNGYQGIDPQGYAGVTATPKKILSNPNNHIFSILGYGAIATAVDYLLGEARDITDIKFLNALIDNSTNTIGNITEKLLENVINRQPTITVEQGSKLTVLVNDNISLPIYYD